MKGVSRYELVPELTKIARAYGWRSPKCETKEGEIVITFRTDEEMPVHE